MITEQETMYFSDVVAAPISQSFICRRDWFVLNVFPDEEDHTITFPYGSRIEVSIYRQVGSGVMGRRELVASAAIVSGESRQLMVSEKQYSFFGAYLFEARYVGSDPGVTIPLLAHLYGPIRKEVGGSNAGQFYAEDFTALAFWVKFDAPLASSEQFSVTEYAKDVAYPYGEVEVGKTIVTVPAGEQVGKIVFNPAFGSRYTMSVTGSAAHKFARSGIV